MIPRLHPPLRPFKPGQRGHLAWLDAVLEINGIIDEPTKHTLLLSTLPADLQYLSAASSASPWPYNALRAAVLAYNGEPYCPPYSEYFASAATKRAVVPSPRPTHASDAPPKPVTPSGTSRPPSSSSLSESMLDVEVDRVDCSIAPSTERSSASETSPQSLSRVPTSPERNPTSSTVYGSSDTTDTSPAVRLPAVRPVMSTVSPAVPETSPFLSPDSHDDVAPESTACKAWHQRSQSRSRLPAAQVQAHCNLLPDFPDAAASTNTPIDTVDGPLAEPPTHSPPSTQPDDQPAALHKPAPLVTPSGSGIAEAPVLLPTDTLSSSLPPEASDTGDATLPAPVDVTTPMVPDRVIASIPRAQFRRQHQFSRRRRRPPVPGCDQNISAGAGVAKTYLYRSGSEARAHTTVLSTVRLLVLRRRQRSRRRHQRVNHCLSIAVATPSTSQAPTSAPLSSVSRTHRFTTPVQVQPMGMGLLRSTLCFEPTMRTLVPRSL
ncbi:hypothetical protein HPB50_019453 [Hyalomma asiaticum]|uniref:Uncharacterized protein n=1 Tax=Hyalomma asiaticum TaxID=266040 RepID=A0ACB7T8R1_HYAAI|nr:hypothetical protein HPB50_019453 [Hyalomma asiaticum]